MKVERMRNGKARKFTTLGGYPLAYLFNSAVLCPDCAGEEEKEETEGRSASLINWEDPFLFCDECGERIESAYAEGVHEQIIKAYDGDPVEENRWPDDAIDFVVGEKAISSLDDLEAIVRQSCLDAGEKGRWKTVVFNGKSRGFVV